MDVLKHGFVIQKYHDLNKRLKPDLQIHEYAKPELKIDPNA